MNSFLFLFFKYINEKTKNEGLSKRISKKYCEAKKLNNKKAT